MTEPKQEAKKNSCRMMAAGYNIPAHARYGRRPQHHGRELSFFLEPEQSDEFRTGLKSVVLPVSRIGSIGHQVVPRLGMDPSVTEKLGKSEKYCYRKMSTRSSSPQNRQRSAAPKRRSSPTRSSSFSQQLGPAQERTHKVDGKDVEDLYDLRST